MNYKPTIFIQVQLYKYRAKCLVLHYPAGDQRDLGGCQMLATYTV
jgi:hypothetical protein